VGFNHGHGYDRAVRTALSSAWLFTAGAAMAGASAAHGRPWVAPGDVPLRADLRSAVILRQDEPLYSRPEPGAARRGSAALGARLPLFAAVRGRGCSGRWLGVGPVAWVCEDVIKPSPEPAMPAGAAPQFPDGLAYRYYFVGPDGSFGYRSLALADEDVPDSQLEPGFAVAVVSVADKQRGDPFGLTTKRMWIPMRDLGAARSLMFEGVTLDGTLNAGWVNAQTAAVYDAAGGRRVPGQSMLRLEAFRVLEQKKQGGRGWFRVGPGRWLSDREVRVPAASAPPAELLPGERWIDVDIETQTLVAYEGERPVFATLVSTGKGRQGTEQATPKGVHRIWIKLRSSDMDNLESEDAARYYAIQDVPWVMYFERGYGLHGTFWHRSFGNVRSHGCVNVSPLDAQRLFHWTSPRLPSGWTAALPSPYEAGTLVRVR